MPQVDIATIRFISGIQFLLLPSFLLLLLWSQRTRAVILWTMGGWLFGIGSLLLLFVLSDPFVGGDVLVRTIFFSALVFRISALKEELDVNVRKFYIFLALAAYVASHEAVRTIFGTELSRQIFTSTITSVTSFYAGFLGLRLFQKERLNGAGWIGAVLSSYGVLFALRVWSLYYGDTTTDQLASSTVSDVIAIALTIFPVIDNLGYLGVCLERSRRSESTAKKIISKHDETDLLNREITHLDRQRTLSLMAANIAHELNQPLTVIRSSSQLANDMLMRKSMNESVMSELIALINQNSSHAANIISNIRRYMMPNEQTNARVNLKDVVSDSVQLMEIYLNEYDIELIMTLIEKPVFVWGSQIELTQVTVNLLKNAVDSLQSKESKRIELTAWADGRTAIICVDDTGSGFPPEVLEQLENEFVTTKQDGMGLGLSICKAIAEQHNGTLNLTNNDMGGASAELRVPLMTNEELLV